MDAGIISAITDACEEVSGKVIAISRYIHSHPEVALQEYRAAAHLTERLRQEGFIVDEAAGGLPTAFRAVYDTGREGPVFAFIAEYDALPEIGHGCGHNLIAASAAGAGIILRRIAPLLRGRILVMGTPAEEAFGGKIQMLKEGVFGDIDATVMLHPATENVVNAGALANSSLTFRFTGKSAHAAAYPEKGVNALNGILLTFAAINALRQHVTPDCRVHGVITRGGTVPNIVPADAEAKFYVRSKRLEELDALVEKTKACARGAALATGTKLEIAEDEFPCADMLNNPVLSQLMEKYMRHFGLTDILQDDPFPGSTDFGNVSHAVPAAYGFVETAPSSMEMHSLEYSLAQVDPRAEKSLLVMTKVLAAVGAEVLTGQEVYDRVREAFTP